MDVTCHTDGDEAKVAIKGRLTFQDHTKFREVIAKVIEAGTPRMSIDLGQVEFIDSAGLGMLLLLREEMRNKSHDLVLRHAQGQVKRMFDIACFDTLFTLEQ